MKRKFADLVDVVQFGGMMEAFYHATGIPYGLIDADNTILAEAGWQEICTKFHRANERSRCRCFESDKYIARHLHAGPFVGYKCANGLMDYAAPIIIDGEHLATIFLGQFLHEPPALDYFRKQAEEFGFDEEAYLAALAKVPVLSRGQVGSVMDFYAKMGQMLAQSGHERLRHLEALDEVVRLNRNLQAAIEDRTRELAFNNMTLEEEVEEHKQVESLLQREHEFVQALIDSMPGIYYLLDETGRLVLWNQNLGTVTGYSDAELSGKNALDLFLGGDVAHIQKRIVQVFSEGWADAEAGLVGKNGKATPYYFTGVRLVIDGRPYLTGVGIDIAERVRSAKILEEKAAAVERSNAELEQFAYVASHDLREPLRMISSYVGLLERRYADKLDAEAHEFIAFAKDGAQRMDRLVLDLLEYSRVGRAVHPKSVLDIRAVIEEALANLSLAIRDTGAAIKIEGEMPTLMGHGNEILRLFQNLIGNALKYRRPDRAPCIGVACKDGGLEWLFSVEDNGIGIDPKYFEHIFLIFQRLHSRKDYEGTGIGLAVCKKIVEHHGGRIWVSSVPGIGTSFHFALPKREG